MTNGISFIFSADKLREIASVAGSVYVHISMDFACEGIPNIKAIVLKQDESEVDLGAANLSAVNGCPYPPGCPQGIHNLNSTFNFL